MAGAASILHFFAANEEIGNDRTWIWLKPGFTSRRNQDYSGKVFRMLTI